MRATSPASLMRRAVLDQRHRRPSSGELGGVGLANAAWVNDGRPRRRPGRRRRTACDHELGAARACVDPTRISASSPPRLQLGIGPLPYRPSVTRTSRSGSTHAHAAANREAGQPAEVGQVGDQQRIEPRRASARGSPAPGRRSSIGGSVRESISSSAEAMRRRLRRRARSRACRSRRSTPSRPGDDAGVPPRFAGVGIGDVELD